MRNRRRWLSAIGGFRAPAAAMMMCGLAACDADGVQAPRAASAAAQLIPLTVMYSSGGDRILTLEEIVALVATKNPSLAKELARAKLILETPAVAQAETISPEEDGGPPDSEMPPSAPGIIQASTAIGLHDNNTRADLVSLTSVSSGIAWKTLRTEGSLWTGSMFNNSEFQSGTKRGFDTQVWSNSFPINCTTQAAGIWADSWHTARWWNLEGERDETADEKEQPATAAAGAAL